MKEGTIKNILDAVRDWVNNKEQTYKPGEIYETVPNEIIKMLWDGDVKFDELVPVTGAEGLEPVSSEDNYLHFIKIFYDIEEIKQNALTFTNHGSIDCKVKFRSREDSEVQSHFFYIDDDELVPLELNEFYTIQPGNELKIVGYHPSGDIHEHGWFDFDNDSWDNKDILLSGKLTSLIDIIGHTDTLPLTANFELLFSYTPISDATALVFPSNTTPSCYSRMFEECYNLIDGPVELPAKQLSDHCYSNMFSSCRSLTKAPKLSATKLAHWCYYEMFIFCNSLTEAPELPATILASSCYAQMFAGCSSLTSAPELIATILSPSCYREMFQGCENLNYIKCCAVDISADNCTTNWLQGVAEEGTFSKPVAVDYSTGPSGIPYNWEIDNYDEIKYLGFSFVGENPDYSIIVGVEKQTTQVDGDSYNIEYSYDKINWITLIDSHSEDGVYWPEAPSEIHSEIYFRGNNRNQFYKYFDGDRDTVGFVYEQEPLLNVFGDITTLLRPEGKVEDLSSWFVKPSYEDTGGEPIIRPAFSGIFGNAVEEGVYTKLQHAQNLLLYSSILSEYCYGYTGLFSSCNNLMDSPELPATVLATNCYSDMFYRCTSLTTVPALHATELADYCYAYMFAGCSSLTGAPALPATTLANSCYSGMFSACSSLVTAPQLPATELAKYCYSDMFKDCTSLSSAPELPATELVDHCYSEMFWNCTGLISVRELPATTLASSCYNYMFYNCISLTTAPILHAINLVNRCYQQMFYKCTSLNYIKCLAVNGINQNNSTANWVKEIASTGTFVKDTSASWPSGVNGIPSGWTIENA